MQRTSSRQALLTPLSVQAAVDEVRMLQQHKWTKSGPSQGAENPLGPKGLQSLMDCPSQARLEGVPMLAMVDQGVHTHACHHALTWPSGLHGA